MAADRMMTAWRVRPPGSVRAPPLGRGRTALPALGPGELSVAAQGCGVCRTDLHVTEGDLPVHRPHVIPGHEVVGEVIQKGPSTGPDEGAAFSVGDRVGIAWLRYTCGVCRFCVRGRENLCPASRYTG